MAKYYLIHQCDNDYEIGRIIEVNENEAIENVMKDKRYGRADKLKCIELSDTEYKYYEQVEQSKRVKRWEDGMFAKICALRPGDLCKAEIDNTFVNLKIISNDIKNGDINLRCEVENESVCDIPMQRICEIFTSNEESRRNTNNPASSLGRMSRTSGSSHDIQAIGLDRHLEPRHSMKRSLKEDKIKLSNKEQRAKFSKSDRRNFTETRHNLAPKEILEHKYCETIELDVIDPSKITNVDEDHQSLDKYIVLITKKRYVVRLLWKGLVHNNICLGCELLTDWDSGTNGKFNDELLFDCKDRRGVLIPLEDEDVRTCEKANGQDHISLNDNEIVPEEQICCVESKKHKSGNIKFAKTMIFGSQPKATDIKWHGLVNGKKCLGIICSEKGKSGRYVKDWIIDVVLNMTPQNLTEMAIIQLNDTHIEFIRGVFVASSNDVRDWVTFRRNGPYDIGELIEVAPFYGQIECFIRDFPLVAIRLDNDQIQNHYQFIQDIIFHDSFFQHGYQGVLVKTDFIQKFNGEFHFINNSWVIDPNSIKYQTESQSERFLKDDTVESVFDGSLKYFKIIDFVLLNGIPCVKVLKATSGENFQYYEYLREENVCRTNISEIETKSYLDTFLDPSSIVVVEELNNNKFAVGDEVEFCSRINDDPYQGTIRRIVKVNGIHSSIVELATKVDEIPKKYQVKENEELNHLCENINSPNFIVLLNIMKKSRGLMEVKGMYMVNPQTVETCKGKNTIEKYIIFKCNVNKYWALLKWKGYINEDIYCIGCEIKCESGFGSCGTNGTFGRHELFKCINGCGVLIPLDKLEDCCMKDGHKKLLTDLQRIDENCICCIRTTERSVLNPSIKMNERIKKRPSKEIGIFKWVGLVNNIEVIGIDSSNLKIPGTDGSFCGLKLFDSNPKCGALFESASFVSEFKRLDDINVNIIDPFVVSVIENGKQIRKVMFLDENNKQTINIKWRGCIDGYLCVGCELMYDSEYGTNGTFANNKLFDCGDRRGVLIPIEEFRTRCELGYHRQLYKVPEMVHRNRRTIYNYIDADSICCVEWLESITRWPKLRVEGRMKFLPRNTLAICKWIGLVNGKEVVGVEMDWSFNGSTGQFSSFKVFSCPNGNGALYMADDLFHDVDNEKLGFIDKIVDTTNVYNIKPLNEISERGINIGEPVMIQMHMKTYIGEVKWIGLLNNEKCVGLDMEERFDCVMDGIVKNKVIFSCLEGHGLVTLLMNVTLWEDAKKLNFMENGLINPNKYLKCEEQMDKSFLEERNVKINDFVFIVIKKEDQQVKIRGTLRWCGLMNQVPVAAVELTRDHEHGTDGRFWRYQLFKCPNKRAITATWTNIYQYLPYEQKIIPKNDRIFPEIDINSAVKYYFSINDKIKELYGTIKWSGINEYGKYLYGLELVDRLTDGTDGTFNGQRLFQCQCGYGMLAPLERINKDLSCVESENELMNKYFLNLWRSTEDRNLELQILKDVMEMKNKRILQSFLEDKGHPVNLEVHQDLLPFLIREEHLELIQLLLNNCDASTIKGQTFLLLANMAIKKDDENLLMSILEKCRDRNELLVNGETFLTNLFKENISEEVINKLIKRKLFNANLTNKQGESPLTLACQRLMASTVEDLISHYPLSANQKQAAMNLTLKAKDNLSGLNRSMEDVLKIYQIFINATTSALAKCSICMDKEINVAFECGHVSCDTCATKLVNCPMCNKAIGKVIKLYI